MRPAIGMPAYEVAAPLTVLCARRANISAAQKGGLLRSPPKKPGILPGAGTAAAWLVGCIGHATILPALQPRISLRFMTGYEVTELDPAVRFNRNRNQLTARQQRGERGGQGARVFGQ